MALYKRKPCNLSDVADEIADQETEIAPEFYQTPLLGIDPQKIAFIAVFSLI